MKMKYKGTFLSIIICSIIFGCSAMPSKVTVESKSLSKVEKYKESDRMLIWKAMLRIEVDNVGSAIEQAFSVVKKNGGYVEKKSIHGEKNASLELRVPNNELLSVLDALAAIGDEESRYLSSEDVTEEFIDTEARLKNSISLRNRLRELLDKAKDVKDILAIEKELNRVQSEIDSMEGRLKRLKGKIDFASISLSIKRKTVFGPLGYIAKGLGWLIEKLFVIR